MIWIKPVVSTKTSIKRMNDYITVYMFEHHIHSTSSSLIHWSRTNKFLSKCLNLLIITHIQIIIYKGWNLKILTNLMSNDYVIFSLSFWLIYNKSNLDILNILSILIYCILLTPVIVCCIFQYILLYSPMQT